MKKGSMQEKIFNSLPIYPAKPKNREILAKELGLTRKKLNSIISVLSPELLVYEDFGEIGRIK